MDFDLSDDQRALRDGAAALLDGMAGTGRVRKVAEEAERFDRELWAAMADQGWLAVDTPASDGGLGLGTVEVAVLCEQLGRHVAPVPVHGTLAVLGALRSGAGNPQTGEVGGADATSWCSRLASGDAVGALAWTSGPTPVTARRDGERWLLSGRTDPVVFAPVADLVVTCAAGDDEVLGLFVVAPSARPAAEPAMDLTRSLARIEMADEPALRVGDAAAVESVIDRATVALCAEMLGAADFVLAETVEYAKDRVQFGRPIGSFQAVKHRCADMLVDVEGMRSATYYAAWAVGAGDADASAAASAAKVWCADASRRVMASALQVHGGIGFTWEHDLHLFVKRAQLDQVSFGDARFHRERLAAILRPRAEAGEPVL